VEVLESGLGVERLWRVPRFILGEDRSETWLVLWQVPNLIQRCFE
jgi:hypothetical protein